MKLFELSKLPKKKITKKFRKFFKKLISFFENKLLGFYLIIRALKNETFFKVLFLTFIHK